MKNVLKLTAVALMVSLAAGCSSSGSSGGGDTAPQFDGDLGFENVDQVTASMLQMAIKPQISVLTSVMSTFQT